jgi:hypothetical protein
MLKAGQFYNQLRDEQLAATPAAEAALPKPGHRILYASGALRWSDFFNKLAIKWPKRWFLSYKLHFSPIGLTHHWRKVSVEQVCSA